VSESNPSGALVTGSTCPCCGSQSSRVFFSADGIPVHAVQLIWEKQKALDCHKGDMRLTFCGSCGFVWNQSFDLARMDYAVDYESTQAFSPTFNRFHESLARDLIDRFSLRNKRVIEVGCGQGEFIQLLCDMGGNQGIGYDPAYIGERERGSMRFVPDYYTEQYSDQDADFLCCKMTLEHIPNAFDFVSRIRKTVASRPDTIVFFQIPDIDRILEERGFWDVYYEHCSYYSAGSLARLFRHAGYEVMNVWRDYGDQYLMIEARPATGAGDALPLEETVTELAERIGTFSHKVQSDREAWRRLILDTHASGRKTVIWGGGSKGVAFLTTLSIGDEVSCAVDINPKKNGTFLAGGGHPVVTPDALKSLRPDLVILMNPIYEEEIAEILKGMDLTPRIVPVDAMARGEVAAVA